jgi:hypothetical protein
MGTVRVPTSLHNRLGHDATNELVELVETAHDDWRDDVMIAVGDRFERRMAEVMSDFRVVIAKELHDSRVEILKWSFIFWLGQMTALVGIGALLIRAAGH